MKVSQTTKKIAKNIRFLLLIALWAYLLWVVYTSIPVYNYFKEHPQELYEWDLMGGSMPEEAKIKLEMYTQTKNKVLLGILGVFLILIVDYFKDPESHFITYLKEKGVFKQAISGEVEDEENGFDKEDKEGYEIR